MKKPTNFTLSLVDPIAASLVLKHERNFPANARDEILARTEDNHDFDFIADPRDLVDRIFRRNGRVGTYYGESWDEILAYNAKQVAAGTPANCVAFADSAGTIPLLAPLGAGKGCGLLKDRSGGNHHRIQTSATARGEMSRRVNLLIATDNYNNVAWNKVRASISPVAALAPDGTLTASKLVEDTTAAADHSLRGQIVAGVVGATYLQSVYLKAGERTSVQFYEVGGPGIFLVNLLNGVVTVIGGASVVNTVDAGSGWWKISYTQVANNAAPVFIYFGLVNPSLIYTGDGVSGVYMWHPSVTLVADSALPYQRVTSASDYDEEGFPAYLRRQTDDWSKTHINPNGATKVFALTAIQKMSDAQQAAVFEASASCSANNGTLVLFGSPSGGGPSFILGARGTNVRSLVIASGSPARSVLGMKVDITGNTLWIGINGSVISELSTNFGGGQFLEYDFFFGARAGTSMFVNDREYSPPLILFMQPSDPGISDAAIRKLTKLFSKGIRL